MAHNTQTLSTAHPPRPGDHTPAWVPLVEQFLGNYFLLLASAVIAWQFRLELPLGREYEWISRPRVAAVLLTLALGLAAAYGLAALLAPMLGRTFNPGRQYRVLLVGALFATMLMLIPARLLTIPLGLPEIRMSNLWLIYMNVAVWILGGVGVFLPRRTRQGDTASIIRDLQTLWEKRTMMRVWLGYRVQARYAQTALGLLWIIMLPLSTALVLTIAFTQFLRIQLDVPFIAFLLSGLVVFNLFQQAVLRSTAAIQEIQDVVIQVYFPREIILLLVLGEALIDALFTFIVMLLINAVVGVFPTSYMLLLPIPLLILVTLTMGLMLLLSWLSALIRDVPQLVAVFLQLFFYASPIIYPADFVPDQLRWVLLLNPIAAPVTAVHDLVVFQRLPDPMFLLYAGVLGAVLLHAGYAVFKANEDIFADLV